MKIGMTGLGRMGLNMKKRIEQGGHEVVGFDVNPDVRDVASLDELVGSLEGPRVVWMMLPLHVIEPTAEKLLEILQPGDIVVDGGNTHWDDTRRRHDQFAQKGIKYLDCGTSGGVWGLENGYALMVGGDKEAVDYLQPIFDALRPEGGGFVYAGESGMGNKLKGIHNAIEYGVMQSFAEGYELMVASGVENPHDVFASWQEGSVIKSWLLDLATNALAADKDLGQLQGYAEDSGEGRWVLKEAVDKAVPAPVLAASLFARFTSRQKDSSAMKMVAALRNQFGGHAVTAKQSQVGDSGDKPGGEG